MLQLQLKQQSHCNFHFSCYCDWLLKLDNADKHSKYWWHVAEGEPKLLQYWCNWKIKHKFKTYGAK